MDILCLPRLATLLLTGAALAAPHAAPAATFVVGAGAGCTHGSIQAAVDAAAASPGFDTIRITRSLAYSNQAIVVEADTGGLEFLGGYADCQTITTSLPRTWVSGAGAPPAAVFSLRGSSSVFLSGLEISDGDNDTGGGGIDIVGGPKTVLLDNLLMRLTDLVISFPRLFVLILLVSFLGHGVQTIIIVIGVLAWMPIARLVRAAFLSLKQKEFVEAARACGASNGHIIRRHLLPNSLGPLIVASTLDMARAIVTESGLSYLGLGVQPPTAS